jgi:RNA polymerase sigma factor (sigma-70 family)
LHEELARDRRRYERLVYGRLRGGICWEDAEDIVSEALIRAHSAAGTDPPAPGREQAWFTRIAFNQGVDFLRARDGRRREGSRPRPDLVSLEELQTAGVELAEDIEHAGTGEAWIEALDDDAERSHAQELVKRVLDSMPAKDAELIKLRHLVGADASRDEVAAMAGLTLGEFRWRHARAWERFVEAVSEEQPTGRCHTVRALIGTLDSADAPPDAPAQIDAHVLECASCRVFARDSYRALELIPVVPFAGLAERWAGRVATLWDRLGPEAAAGGGAAAGAGAGATGLAGAGGLAGALKTIAAVCTTTAVTAGVCGGVLVLNDRGGGAHRDPSNASQGTRAAASPTAAPAVSANRSPRTTPINHRVTSTVKPESSIPASASPGSREFEPSGSGAAPDPAPTPPTGGGEFGP